MALTLQEAKAELVTINSAISSIYSGNRINVLSVGTNEFSRMYRFTDPQDLLKTLLMERKRLQDYVDTLEPATSTRLFRQDCYVPLVVKRTL